MPASSPHSSTSSLSDNVPNSASNSPQTVLVGLGGSTPSSLNGTSQQIVSSSGPGTHTNSSLPHKLRHKARNATADGDCGSDGLGSLPEDCSGDLPVEEAKVMSVGYLINADGSALKEENYTLRKELQRLAGEVAALKTIMLPLNSSAYSADGDRASSSSCQENENENEHETENDNEDQDDHERSNIGSSSPEPEPKSESESGRKQEEEADN